MGLSKPLTSDELRENQRWQERYGDVLPPLEFSETDTHVKIGDEYLAISDLEEADRKHPQPKDHPFKPHHYLTQKELEIIRRGLR